VSTLPSWTTGVDLTRWFEQTAWWDGPMLGRAPQQALAEMLEAVAGRFTGRELSLQLRGRAVRFQVDAVQVRGRQGATATPSDDPFAWLTGATRMRDVVRWSREMFGIDNAATVASIEAVEFDAHDVVIDEELVGTVAVRVHGVRLEPTVSLPEIVTGSISLDVRTTRSVVLGWLRRAFPAWDVQPHRGDDLLVVRGPGWRLPLLLRASVDATTVHTEAVGVIVFGRAVRLPRFLVRSRTFAVPPLEPGMELDAVTVDGDDVRLAFRHAGVRQRVHLDAVRGAVRDGVTRLGNTIFG
jgi:hypothetical protein